MNLRRVWLPLVSLLLAAGCGGSSSGSGGGGGASCGQPSTSSGSTGSGGASAIPVCKPICNCAADCAIPEALGYDESHFTCDNQACQYTGCKPTDDCAKILNKPAACKAVNGAPIPTCHATCKVPADCATPGVPAYDASHYACDDGLCAYTGCKTPADCAVPGAPAFDASHYTCTSGFCAYTGCTQTDDCAMVVGRKKGACMQLAGATIPTCQPICDSAVDCVVPDVPAYDVSHYACNNNLCEYTGCATAKECTDALQAPAICK